MKIAFFSDIHSNIHAFEACLEDAWERGAEQIAILGDLVGYGAFPTEVTQRCIQLQQQGALVLGGNHEAMAVDPPADFSTFASLSSHWTHRHLSAVHRQWLAELPLTAQVDSVYMVHASADAPEKWRYVDVAQVAQASLQAAAEVPKVRYVFGGHVHHQMLYYLGSGRGLMRFDPTPGSLIPVPSHRYWLATVGSVGQPRDGDPRAAYVFFDTEQKQLTFHRIDYDHTEAAQAIRAAGLPEALAIRLETGR